MRSVQQIFVLSFIVLGVCTTGSVGKDLPRENEAQPVCQHETIINPLDGPSDYGAACNYSRVKETFSDEIQSTTHRLVQLEKNVASNVDAVSEELIDIKEFVRELSEFLKNTTDIDKCAVKPCLNGGVCVDLVNDYRCDCMNGYKGKDCEINIDECALTTCIGSLVCVDGINSYCCVPQSLRRNQQCGQINPALYDFP